MLIVGLTGGVASGKSTVSAVLREEGLYLIDADQIARELVRPHTTAWDEIIRRFGEGILREDGSIHRKKLADLVYSDPEKRGFLNQLLHPRIQEEIQQRLIEIGRRDPDAIVIIDAALLVETGWYREMDRLIVVVSTEAQQIERLASRDGLSREEARRILSAQMPIEKKRSAADWVIRNEDSIEETRRRAKQAVHVLREWALQKRKEARGSERTDRDPKGGEKRGL